MTEKEIEEYTKREIKAVIKETECDDCTVFVGKDGAGYMCIFSGNEDVLVSNIKTMIRAYGELGENPYRRQVCLLRALVQNLANEITETIEERNMQTKKPAQKSTDIEGKTRRKD
nr:MAG TPA: hypothetical protein [Caudoviricetes sp.]